MKKYLVTLAITALATSAFAQGTITFANNATGLVKQWTTATDTTLMSVPKSGGFVELLAAPKGSSLTPLSGYSTMAAFLAANTSWAVVATTAIFPVNGQFSGGGKTIANIGAGADASYFLVGWTGASATYDAAYTAWQGGTAMLGESSVFSTATGNPNAVPVPGTPVSLAGSFTGMTLTAVTGPVPEPSTFALAGLGAAALMIFRRRK
jgi:hypothetical protein